MKNKIILSLALSLAFLSGERGSAPAPFRLTVATWNVENFSRRRSGLYGEGNRMKGEALARIMAYDLECPDIIALQEIMDDSGIEDDGTLGADRNFRFLARSLRRFTGIPWGYITLPPEDGEDGGREGANIRTGFLYNRERIFPASPPLRWDDRSFAGCRKPLAARFYCGGCEVTLVNVHLSSRTGEGQEGKRREQGVSLQSRIGKMLRENRNGLVLLLGDFNDYPESPLLEGLERAASLVSLAEGTTYIFRNRAEQLDHILASPALASCHASSRRIPVLEGGVLRYQPSDHNPLGAEFYLPPLRVFSTTSVTPAEQGPPARIPSRFSFMSLFRSPSS